MFWIFLDYFVSKHLFLEFLADDLKFLFLFSLSMFHKVIIYIFYRFIRLRDFLDFIEKDVSRQNMFWIFLDYFVSKHLFLEFLADDLKFLFLFSLSMFHKVIRKTPVKYDNF